MASMQMFFHGSLCSFRVTSEKVVYAFLSLAESLLSCLDCVSSDGNRAAVDPNSNTI